VKKWPLSDCSLFTHYPEVGRTAKLTGKGRLFLVPGSASIAFNPRLADNSANWSAKMTTVMDVKDIRTSRRQDSELWVLKKDLSLPLMRLNQRLSEGAAVSKNALRIAWSNTEGQYPDEIPKGHTRFYVADIDYAGGTPRLANKRMVLEGKDPSCRIEAQDFYDNDTKLTYTCYRPGDKAEVMGLDLKTGKVTNFSLSPETYNEVEGIFPDGQHACVEADRQGNGKGSHHVDIWKLKLNGTGKNFERLTYFTDYEGYKASNPVVSNDGKMMAFQLAMSKDEAGVGYGVLVYRFDKT